MESYFSVFYVYIKSFVLISQGYPLTVCPDAMLKIAEFATLNDRLVAMNLSAPFLCTFFQEPMLKMLPHVDVLFGNEAVICSLSPLCLPNFNFSIQIFCFIPMF